MYVCMYINNNMGLLCIVFYLLTEVVLQHIYKLLDFVSNTASHSYLTPVKNCLPMYFYGSCIYIYIIMRYAP